MSWILQLGGILWTMTNESLDMIMFFTIDNIRCWSRLIDRAVRELCSPIMILLQIGHMDHRMDLARLWQVQSISYWGNDESRRNYPGGVSQPQPSSIRTPGTWWIATTGPSASTSGSTGMPRGRFNLASRGFHPRPSASQSRRLQGGWLALSTRMVTRS